MEDFNGSCTQGILKKESVSSEMSKVINCAALLYINFGIFMTVELYWIGLLIAGDLLLGFSNHNTTAL